MDLQQPQVMVSEWDEPETCVESHITDTEQVPRPQVEVVIQSSANDGNVFFRQILDGLETATLFEWVETEVELAIATNSLNKKHKLQLEYQVGEELISKNSCDKDSFDKALQEALTSSSTCITITASLAPPQSTSTLSREKAHQILTRQIIEKTTGKYIVPKTALDEFRNQELMKNICAEDSTLRKLQSDHPSLLKDLQRGPKCGWKLFAIFILAQVSDLGGMLTEFWDFDLLDQRLPFIRSNKPTFCEKQFWLSICDTQWQVLPIELAQLGPGELPAKYDKDRCLPFGESEKLLGKGGFGVVVEIQLDTDHPKLYVAEDEHVSHTEGSRYSQTPNADHVLGQANGQPTAGS